MRVFRFVVLPLLTLGILAAAIAANDAAARSQVNQALLTAMRTTSAPAGETYPALVARVGDRELSGQDFVRLVAISSYTNAQHHTGLTRAQVITDAVSHFVREAALVNRAKAEGITASEAEVAAYIRAQADIRSHVAPNDPGLADFNAAMAASGNTSPQAFDRDPRILRHTHDLLLMGKLLARHLGPNPKDSIIEAFVQQTIANSGAQVFLAN